MTLHTFSKASKEILLVALLLLSLFAVQESNAASKSSEVTTMANNSQTNTMMLGRQLTKQIELAMRLEIHTKNSAILLEKANAQFEADKISAEDLFMATIIHYQLVESLEKAKVVMVSTLNNIAKEQSPSLIAH